MILVSVVVSAGVVFGERVAIERGLLPAPWSKGAPAAEPPASTAEVPSLAGMSLDAAGEVLQARGLTLRVSDKQPHATVPVDAVVAQEPLAGSVLPTQSPVSVTLSSGPPQKAPLPDVSGQSLANAMRALEAAGLVVGTVTGPPDGLVDHSEPAAATPVAPGARVSLALVAEGVPVPKLIGLSWPRARKVLKESGLEPGKVRVRYDDNRDALIVLQQSPEAGTSVAPGSSVDIVRNEGY